MTYRELIKRMQHYSGFSDSESQDALVLFVENLASRLTIGERKDFASQLPIELQDVALTNRMTRVKTAQGFIDEFRDQEDIDEKRAKKQIFSAWKTIKDEISPGEVKDIQAQLPNELVETLLY